MHSRQYQAAPTKTDNLQKTSNDRFEYIAVIYTLQTENPELRPGLCLFIAKFGH